MAKQRLTITLSQSTLNKIDRLIDKKQIRSRSHAIESILQDHLEPSIKTAIILAGGHDQPQTQLKPLIPFKGKPLIAHTLQLLTQYHIQHIIILAHHSAKRIQTVIAGKFPQLKIEYVFEQEPLGTAGALKNASELITNPFFCIYGDIYTDINLQQMANFHQQHQSLATIAVKPRMSHQSFDNVALQGSQVTNFQPKDKQLDVSLVNTGVYLFQPQLLDYIPQTPSTLEQDVFPRIIKTKRLFAFTFQGAWFDVATEKNYQKDLQQSFKTTTK